MLNDPQITAEELRLLAVRARLILFAERELDETTRGKLQQLAESAEALSPHIASRFDDSEVSTTAPHLLYELKRVT